MTSKCLSLLLLATYTAALGPGAGGWILCASGDRVTVNSALQTCSCCTEAGCCQEPDGCISASPEQTVTCPHCTDTPMLFPVAIAGSPVKRLAPPQSCWMSPPAFNAIAPFHLARAAKPACGVLPPVAPDLISSVVLL